ncbi:Maltose/maltodextrin ABC transporter, permease protein MalG [Micrococcus lylae]|uniref:Maltose/maltodextrin ABC transporter, permease protein MalG n=2 Tax=Micrococcus lylae TaxID=1273 RepID=A0A1R4JML9_9MICC|nr:MULTISPECIES: sugar ABC transporter permease [Micrococcus]MCT2006579.1 sugar ABC transporter permease [Micrococcus lylae]MCT2070522.1 sugar ABC transporter permease [Micrococcus lylae]SJN33237.1 Maltose/maltodextrin ABC transporter, permease protein MalG [Micrococcus lylae]
MSTASTPQGTPRPGEPTVPAGPSPSGMAAALAAQEKDPIRWEETDGPSGSRRSFGKWFKENGWRHIVGVLASAFSLFPLLYVLSASFDPTGTMASSNSLFSSFSLQNYVDLFNDEARPYAKWFMNTMIIGIVTSVSTVFLGALAAYAFSRMRFAGRRVGLLTLLLVQMFPQLLAVVAIFLLLTYIGDIVPVLGIGSQLGLILVYLGGALGVNTYLMYGFFNTIPQSLDEAAKLDGASHVQIFFQIILRLVTPILAVVALLSFISTVSEFVIASVVLTDPGTQTLAVGLFGYVSETRSENWGVFAAGAVLAALPVMALFLFLQKYIVSGLTAGGVKG